jgi:SAM-dependent methyltransferase
MHIEARNFTVFIKNIFSDYFINKRVLDVGCGDINGNNLFLFENCHYEGNDVYKGSENVTIVSKTKDLQFSNEYFDTIISTECFEHDPEYKLSLLKIYDMLKNNGLFVFTCASTGRDEHGTRRTTKNDSFGTIFNIEDMQDYYKNLTEKDLNEVLNLNKSFSYWKTYYNVISKDIYFVGIKKQNYPDYIDHGVSDTSNNI